ncbi:MAG: PAS domain-containing protein [Candidatus Margulisiibacteriota bacterium]
MTAETNVELLQIADYMEDMWAFLPIPIVHVSPVGIITDADQAAAEYFGQAREDIIGQKYVDLFDDVDLAEKIGRETIGVGKVVNRESMAKKKSGETYPVLISTLLRRDDQNVVVGFFASIVDLTQSKKAETELVKLEERYRNTLDSMLEGFQIIGYDWRYLYVNDVCARQGKRKKEELLGHSMMEAYPGIEKTEMFSRLKRCMEQRVPFRMENEFVFPDGSRGWFELNIQPMADGIFVVSQDISEQRRAATELEKKVKELEEFHSLAVGRELRMIELEKEINKLLAELGRPPKFTPA